MSSPQQRRERSYTLVNTELVQAEILPRNPQIVGGVTAEVREISQATVKLLVTGPPELRYECRIVLKSHRFKSAMHLPAEVHWARPNPAGDWLLGCRFDEPLSDATFQELINSGVLNRRNSVRERSRIPVQAQLHPGKPRLPAIVSDFSEGGLCLTVGDEPQGTCHVCVFGSILGQEVRIPLKIRWTLSVGPNRFIGCQFMRTIDYQSLRKLHLATQKQPLDEYLNSGLRVNRSRTACADASCEPVESQPIDRE